DEESVDQVESFASLGSAVFTAAPDHVEAVVDVDLEQFAQAQGLRLAVDEGDVVDAEGFLHRREPVELLQDGFGVEAVLQLDDQAQTLIAVGEVLQVRDSLESLGLHQLLDAADDLLRSHVVGEFGDDQAVASGRDLFDGDRGAGLETAASTFVGVPDAVETDDGAAGGQVRSGDDLHELVQGRVRFGDQMARGGHDLAEVVGGHVGGHPDRDAGGAVHQQVRERGGQDFGFGLLSVVVRLEVDDVLVDTFDHQLGGSGQPCLGVTHGGGCVVTAQGTEVAVPVDQGHTHGEGLAEPDQGVVDGGVAVGVQTTHHVPDHAGTFDVTTVRSQPHFVHLIEDAPLHRFHAVACVRQSALVDDRVRVLQAAASHLLGDV